MSGIDFLLVSDLSNLKPKQLAVYEKPVNEATLKFITGKIGMEVISMFLHEQEPFDGAPPDLHVFYRPSDVVAATAKAKQIFCDLVQP